MILQVGIPIPAPKNVSKSIIQLLTALLTTTLRGFRSSNLNEQIHPVQGGAGGWKGGAENGMKRCRRVPEVLGSKVIGSVGYYNPK